MSPKFKVGDKVKVREWGEGVIIGSCPWWEGGSNMPGHASMKDIPIAKVVWIVKISETGKVVSTLEKELELV